MAINTISGAIGTELITIKGSEVSDLLIVSGDRVYIDGLAGDDTISSSSGVEQLVIDGGADDDKLIFEAEILESLLNLGIGNDQVIIQDFSGDVELEEYTSWGEGRNGVKVKFSNGYKRIS